MNIRDISNTYNNLQTNSDTDMTLRTEMPARQEQPTVPQDEYIRKTETNPENANVPSQEFIQSRPEQQIERNDEYIRSTVAVHDALYSISNVNHGRQLDTSNRFQEMRYSPEGEKTTRKIIDIILSTGMKKLSIFRLEA